jgi:hypothetical protein
MEIFYIDLVPISLSTELILKDREKLGFDFCITEQLFAAIHCDFDQRRVPFDHYRLEVEMSLRKKEHARRWFMEVRDGAFFSEHGPQFDFDEHIPYWCAHSDELQVR